MTDEIVKKTKYKYELNAGLVLQGGRDGNRENEPSGEGATLAGRKLEQFGGLAQKDKPPELKKLKEKAQKKQENQAKKQSKEVVNSKKYTQFNVNSDKNVLNVEIAEDLVYRPKTKETKIAYDQFLYLVQKHMGDEPLETIKGAADEVLAILKMESQNDRQRKEEIESILDKTTDENFNNLTILAQQLVDFNPETNMRMGGNLEEEIQVNVEFDDDQDQGGDDDSDFDQVKDNEDELQEQDDDAQDEAQPDQEEDEKMAIDTSSIKDKRKGILGGSSDHIDLDSIDTYWLNNLLDEAFKDTKSPEEILELERNIMGILGDHSLNVRVCEKQLFHIVGYNQFQMIKLLVKNRHQIYFQSRIQQAQTPQEKKDRMQEIQLRSRESEDIKKIYEHIIKSQGGDDLGSKKTDEILDQANLLTSKYQLSTTDMQDILTKKSQVTDAQLDQKFSQAQDKKYQQLDLDNLTLENGARHMANKKCILPKGSTKIVKQGYEEVYVPAIRHKQREDGEKLIPIKDLPAWAQGAFPEYIKELNQIQSRLYKSAFLSSENLLVCAPTGAGKTNIALLTILQLLGEKRKNNGKFDIKSFKIVYIAPMKALVSEVVGNFDKRLSSFGITVKELTGDVNLTKSQIEETQIIVTTPEKWDIVTRKSGDRAFVDLVKLIIIDEIHLLHDLRGPVLEAIVARTIRQIESNPEELVRIVALSATLPNYEDVAAFLRVNINTGLHYFDNSYRPVPLEQIYVGITEKKAIKRLMLMNEICYEKVIERAEKQYQILVFVHSRKETIRTAKIIRDLALAKDELHKFLGAGGENMSKEILENESKTARSQDLKDLLPYGIGIHNAGLARKDRQLVEQLFAANHIKVLVSTATLAWGVNLPAHTVIIKGTQIYSPEQGKWIELSPQDMLQMIGRAGRPQYDKLGEGIVITNYSELQYYLSLNNHQLPIESQLVTQLPDQLNAEIVLGTVSNSKEAINWLAYSYLYIRMLRAPEVYKVEITEDDPLLIQRRADLVHSAALVLAKANMIKYEKRTGTLLPTALGKIAAHYYIKHGSMSIYNENLKPHMNVIDIFRLFSLSKEFQFIPIRDNEKLELLKFIDKVPIPVKGSLDEGSTKINILLQAYISKFKLDGYDLNADLVYVTQSAGRLMRALFEICSKRNWAQLTEITLSLCKMVDKKMWASSMTPLRQFPGIPEEIFRKIEKKEQFSWQHYYDMSAQQIGEILKSAKMGKLLHKFIHQFPRLELEAFIQPITRTIIRIELSITPDFEWEPLIHGKAEAFQIIVEDCDQEQILHQETFILKDRNANEEHIITFTVPLYDPLPPQYFIKVISDKWIQSETVLPVNFRHLVLPERFVSPMELQDMHPRLVQELNFKVAEEYFAQCKGGEGLKEFNSIQTQAFNKLYNSDESIFIGAPAGSDNIVCGELAIFRQLQSESTEGTKIVYISPLESQCRQRFQQWNQFFTNNGLKVKLLLNTQANVSQLVELEQVKQADIVISTPEKWDNLSRKWKIRKQIQDVGLYILDEIHMIGEYSTYEVVASRIRYIQSELQEKHGTRIIALSTSLANAKDVSNWLGIPFPQNTFNFYSNVRPVPLEIQIQGYDHNNKATRVLAMEKPAFNMLKKHLQQGQPQSDKGSKKQAKNSKAGARAQGIVFVSDKKQARLTAISFLNFTASDENQKRFLNVQGEPKEKEFLKKIKAQLSEQILLDSLEIGIGLIHDGLSQSEISFIKSLYAEGTIGVLLVTENLCWEISDLKSHLSIVLDAEKYDGNQHRFVEYTITDVLQMIGSANKSLQLKPDSAPLAAQCVIFCHSPKKEYYIKFLLEPLPIESSLDSSINDHLNSNIVAEVIKTKQDAVDWFTWTFLYRRISQNPNYYNILGRSGQHINDFLSELVETAVEQLQKAQCVEVKGEDEMDLEAGVFGRIAGFYNIKWETMAMFNQELGLAESKGDSKKLKDLINILAQSSEFQTIPMRIGEDMLLKSLAPYLTYPVEGDDQKYNDLTNKIIILLQCHFNRTPINADLRLDQKHILEKAVKLVHAMVDVTSSQGYLKPCLFCLTLSQMIVQAMWYNQSPLLQLPFVTLDQAQALKDKAQVEDIADLNNMDDVGLRSSILSVTDDQLNQIAAVSNRFPYIELTWERTSQDALIDGESAEIEVTLRRINIEEDELELFQTPVPSKYYPLEKEEQWWIIIGDPRTNKLLGIKKANFKGKIETKNSFSLEVNYPKDDGNNKGGPKSVEYKVSLYCDSYIGCDQEEIVTLKVQKQ